MPDDNYDTEVTNGNIDGHSTGAAANGRSYGHVNGNGEIGHTNGTRNGTANGVINGHATCPEESSLHLLTWSAADKDGLSRLAGDWETYLDTSCQSARDPRSHLASLAHTLNERRTHHPWRTFAVAEHNSPGKEVVDSWTPPVQSSADVSVGFVFTGVRIRSVPSSTSTSLRLTL
jgi:hypothetical protein